MPPKPTAAPVSPGRQAWHQAQLDAMAKARTQYEITFTDYSPGNMVDAVGHSLAPFWTYESQRFQYLSHLFIRHPGALTGMSRFYNETDEGRIRVPGTSLEVSPFSGTVLMGAFRGLYIRDYPEYEDNFPGMAGFFNFVGRYGFYPGIQFTAPLAIYGSVNGKADWGAIMPGFVKTPIDAWIWMFPKSESAKLLRDHIMPDRMREVLAIRALGDMNINGYDIYRKIHNNIPLLPEEQSLWDNAMGTASGYNALMEQGFPIRMRSEKQAEAYEAMNKFREEVTGVPIELQEWINETRGVTGKSFQDYFPLDPLQQSILNEMDAIKIWSGTSAPLQPSGLQQEMFNIQEYWDERGKIRLQALDGFYKDGKLVREGRRALENRVKKWYRGEEGGISIDQYKTEMANLNKYISGQVEAMDMQDRFREVPRTLEDRKLWAEKHGNIQPVWHPAKELLWLYYELEPKQVWDEESQTMEWDYDSYYGTIDYIIAAIPEPYRTEFKKTITREMTDLQKLNWDISSRYLAGYRAMREAELERYEPDQRAVIQRFYRANAVERDELREVKIDEEHKLISTFNRNLTTARKNVRLLHPELNAWITFFNTNVDLLTDTSEKIYKKLQAQHLGN